MPDFLEVWLEKHPECQVLVDEETRKVIEKEAKYDIRLSSGEEHALLWLYYDHGGAVLSTVIDGPATKDCFGDIETPGERVIKKLIKKGYVVLTEEDDEDDLDLTPMYQLTDEGEALVKTIPR